MTPTLRFATFLAPNVLPVYQSVADSVGRQLGFQTELAVGSSFDQFARGEIDAGFVCGLPYIALARQVPAPIEPIAAPVLACERYAGRPVSFSDVIVRRDSPIRSFAELRGRSWAFNDRNSLSAFALPRFILAEIGETWDFVGRVVEAGSHQRVSGLWPPARWTAPLSTPRSSPSSRATTGSWSTSFGSSTRSARRRSSR